MFKSRTIDHLAKETYFQNQDSSQVSIPKVLRQGSEHFQKQFWRVGWEYVYCEQEQNSNRHRVCLLYENTEIMLSLWNELHG